MDDFLDLVMVVVVVVAALVTVVGLPGAGIAYYAACREARVYNALHGSTYSCGDFFWASNQINAGATTVHLDGRLR